MMTASFSDDLRKRLIEAVESGSSCRSVAARFSVSPSAVIKTVQRYQATGSTAPGKIGGYRAPVLADQEDFLRKLTSSRKGITLEEIREALLPAQEKARNSAVSVRHWRPMLHLRTRGFTPFTRSLTRFLAADG